MHNFTVTKWEEDEDILENIDIDKMDFMEWSSFTTPNFHVYA